MIRKTSSFKIDNFMALESGVLVIGQGFNEYIEKMHLILPNSSSLRLDIKQIN